MRTCLAAPCRMAKGSGSMGAIDECFFFLCLYSYFLLGARRILPCPIGYIIGLRRGRGGDQSDVVHPMPFP